MIKSQATENTKDIAYTDSCIFFLKKRYQETTKSICKEIEVSNHIIERFFSITVMQDKRIQDGCSARRPDILIGLGNQVIIVEVDESQHIDYDCTCENKRLMQLSQDVGRCPIVFICFNPDAYTENGLNVASCFMQNKLGYLVKKKSKQKERQHRLSTLCDTIQY